MHFPFPVFAWAWALASFVSFFLVSAAYKGQPADGAQGAADPTSGPSVAVFLRPLALLLPRSSPDGCDLFDGTGTTIAVVTPQWYRSTPRHPADFDGVHRGNPLGRLTVV